MSRRKRRRYHQENPYGRKRLTTFARMINEQSDKFVAEVVDATWYGGRKCMGGRIYVSGPVEYKANRLVVKIKATGLVVFQVETAAGFSAGIWAGDWMRDNGLNPNL